jgi:putative oxidoreductase
MAGLLAMTILREVFMICGKTRSALEPVALTFLRIFVGIVMAAHGWQKIQNFAATMEGFAGMGFPYPKVMVALSIAGEFGGGLGLIVGLLTPLAALGVFCVMATAILKVHLPNGLFAKDGGFEYPGTILFVALFFVFHGGGPISLDHLFCRKPKID